MFVCIINKIFVFLTGSMGCNGSKSTEVKDTNKKEENNGPEVQATE